MERWTIRLLVAIAFLAPLKFGTMVVIQWQQVPPSDLYGWLLQSWPNVLGVMLVFAGVLVWASGDRVWMQKRDGLFWLPAVFLVTQAVAMPGTIHRQASIDALLHFGAGVILFYAAAWHVRDGASVARVFQGLAVAAFLVCVVALDQRFGFLTGGFDASRDLMAAMKLSDEEANLLQGRLEAGRVFGTFAGYANALAGFLGMVMGPTLVLILNRARKWNQRFTWLTLAVAAGLAVWCMWLTGSRGGFVVLAVAAIAGACCRILTGSAAKRVGWLLAVLVAVVSVVVVVLVVTDRLPRGSSSILSRLDYWRGATAIARDHPWLGTGPGTFGSIYPLYKTAPTEESQAVHNDFLQMWSDAGIFAFLVYAGLWAVGLRDAFRLVKARGADAASVGLVMFLSGWVTHSLIDFDLYVPGIAWPAFLMLGMVQGLKDPVVSDEPANVRGGCLMLRISCLVLVSLLCMYCGRLFRANIAYGRALGMEMERRTLPSVPSPFPSIKQAVHLAPSIGRYQMTAGDIAMDEGRFSEAEQYYRLAIEQDPYRSMYHKRLATSLAAQGRMDETLAVLQQAAQLNPTSTSIQQAIGKVRKSIRQPFPPLLESHPANGTNSQ